MKKNVISFQALQKRCDNHARWQLPNAASKFIIRDIPHEVMQELLIVDVRGPVRILPKDGKIVLFGSANIFLRGTLSDMKHDVRVVMTRKRKLQIERASFIIKSTLDRSVQGATYSQSVNM